MAANYIEVGRNTDLGRMIIRGISQIRDGKELLAHTRDCMLQMRDGDGTLAAHYDVVASEGGFVPNDYADANAAAKASFDEIDALLAKINTDNTVDSVLAAINQACAKHGV